MGKSAEVIMFSNRMILGGLCVAGVVAATGMAARADNITVSGVACKNYNAAEALDIDYQNFGVQNVNAGSRFVICPVPRSPLNNVIPTQFYVDGFNSAGTSTSCTATLYDFSGDIITSVSFTQSTPTWDQGVTFSIAPTTWDYVSVLCLLPGNRGGTILGAASLAP
jgi:hypothetical protein